MADARVHSIETFSGVDGPGIRFVLFLNGCRLRCRFCHNPDTWDGNSGERKSAQEILAQALRYRDYWGDRCGSVRSDPAVDSTQITGGITVSGGEPLLQMDFLTEFFRLAKKEGIHTCIDTAGEPFTTEEPWLSKFSVLMDYTDLLLVDIKQMNRKQHIRLTGRPNDNILSMFSYLDRIHKPVWIRQVLVPGWTDDPEDLRRERNFIDTLSNVQKVEVLPYHTLGVYKWEKMGMKYPLSDVKPPDAAAVRRAEEILLPQRQEQEESLFLDAASH